MSKRNIMWEEEARKHDLNFEYLDSLHPTSYLRAISILLREVDRKGEVVSALKTDLWNEGVETTRDVLGTLEEEHGVLNTFGIDISRPNCEHANERLRRTLIVNGDIRALPFANESFDIILDLSTIDHVPLTETPTVLGEYRRVLRKSGMLLLIFWYAGGLLRLSQALRKPAEFEMPPYRYYFPVKSIQASMRGFRVVNKFWMLGWGGGAVARTGKRAGRRLYMFYLRLAYSRLSALFKPFGGMCVMIARRKADLE